VATLLRTRCSKVQLQLEEAISEKAGEKKKNVEVKWEEGLQEVEFRSQGFGGDVRDIKGYEVGEVSSASKKPTNTCARIVSLTARSDKANRVADRIGDRPLL